MKYVLIVLFSIVFFGCEVIPPPETSGDTAESAKVEQDQVREIERSKAGDVEALRLAAENPKGVLILFHGYGSNPEDIIELGKRLRVDWEIWAPRAPVELREGHYAWFELQFDEKRQVKRGNEEKALAEWGEKLHRFALSKKRRGKPLVVAGFSQGATVSMILATRESPQIAGVASLSGWLPGTENPIYPNRNYFVAHGEKDQRISIEEARKLRARLNPERTKFRVYTGMRHTVSGTVLNDLRDWLKKITERPEFN